VCSSDLVIAFAIPRGYFLPTTPGTRFVTLGGAVANDVHGKNHHCAGTFGNHVTALGLVRSDGAATVRPGDGLFAATIGGLGLTGVIAWVELALTPVPSSLIDQEIVTFEDLDAFFALAAESEATHEHTVAWIDCLARGASLGRGVFSRGNFAADGPLEVRPRPAARRVPADAPGFLLNRYSLGTFNALYYRLQRRKAGTSRVPYDGFFYPLDGIGDWNRLYGRRGFYQYQSVVPPAAAREATHEMLRTITEAGEGSFLAVIKTFGGSASPGLLSFPMKGTTLALDLANRGAPTLALMERLDAVVREAGGRFYPAKDGRIPPDLFRSGYPALDRFADHVDPAMGSRFWRRVAGCAA